MPVQSAFDQGRLANLTSFVNNAVLFTVAATHVVELTRSAVSGNAGNYAASSSHSLLLCLSECCCKWSTPQVLPVIVLSQDPSAALCFPAMCLAWASAAAGKL